MGWSTTQSALNTGTVNYNPGYVFTLTSDLNLYAVWRSKHTLSYDANGGSGAPASRATLYGYTYTVSTTQPTRTGYSFRGWSTVKSAPGQGTVQYASGSSITMTGNVTLYALWNPNKYTVTLIYNDGLNGKATLTKVQDVALPLLPSPTKIGYTFKGWATSSGSTTVAYQPGASYSGNSPLTFYGVWAANQYTITFNPSGGNCSTTSKTYTYGQPYGTLPSATKQNYDFVYWYMINASNTGIIPVNSTSVVGAGNNTLYAYWQQKQITITYQAKNGLPVPASQPSLAGNNLTLTAVSDSTHYEFKGWTTEPDGTTAMYANNGTYAFTANVTLYPIWKAKTYTITYDSRGGLNGPGVVSVPALSYIAISTISPTKDGYIFCGWTASSTSTTPGSWPSVFQITGNMEFHAIWEDNQIRVTFDPNGGTCTESYIDYTHGELYGEMPTATRKEGDYELKFLGWYTSRGVDEGIEHTAGRKVPSDDITLYARWAYTITYNYYSYESWDGTWGKNEEYCPVGDNWTITDYVPTRMNGYIFWGWTEDKTKTLSHDLIMATKYVQYPANKIIEPDAPLKLYGVWSLDTSGWTDDDYINDFLCAPAVEGENEKIRGVIEKMPSDYKAVYMKALKEFRKESCECILLRRSYDVLRPFGQLAGNYITVNPDPDTVSMNPILHEWGHLVDRYYDVGINIEWLRDTVSKKIRAIAEFEIDALITEYYSIFIDEAERAGMLSFDEYKEVCIRNVLKNIMRYSETVELTEFQSKLLKKIGDNQEILDVKFPHNGSYGVLTTLRWCEGSSYLVEGDQATSEEKVTGEAIANIFAAMASGDQAVKNAAEKAFPGISDKADIFMQINAN
ncbi:MAG: InlB B-repeat-containing protein [Oscillospiraceae bacterium]|nr:InlB B-repeat-containing protein [Oscillospiraceae bacterium]